MLVEGVESQPVLPVLKRLGADQSGELRDRARMIGLELLDRAELRRIQQRTPVDPWCFLLELGAGPDLRALGEILAFLTRDMRLRDLGLEVHDPAGSRLGVGIARELQDLADVGAVLAPDLRHLRIAGQIIFALRQPDSALHQIGQLLAGRVQPLRHEDAEKVLGLEIGGVQRVGVGTKRATDRGAELLLVCDPRNYIQIGFRRGEAGAIDRIGVDVGIVVIGDPALVRVASRLRFQNLVEQRLGVLLAKLVGDVEAADARPVRRYFSRLHPAAVSVRIEIVPGRDRRVHPARLDSGLGAFRLFLRRVAGRACTARG